MQNNTDRSELDSLLNKMQKSTNEIHNTEWVNYDTAYKKGEYSSAENINNLLSGEISRKPDSPELKTDNLHQINTENAEILNSRISDIVDSEETPENKKETISNFDKMNKLLTFSDFSHRNKLKYQFVSQHS